MKIIRFCIMVLLIGSIMTAYAQEKGKTSQKKKNRKEATVQQGQVVSPQTKPLEQSVEQSSRQPAEQTVDPEISVEQVMQIATPVVQEKPNGLINWTEQYVEAKGMSVIDYDRFPNQAQARAMAIRGAIVEAQRNLLEIVQGVNVVSETKVKDMMVQSDFIYTRVEGLVKGAQQVGEPIEKDGMIEVRLRMPLYGNGGLASAVYEQATHLPLLQQRATTDPSAATGDVLPQGLVFMMNGKQIDPALFPLVVDQNGRILLDMTKLYDPKTGKFPRILTSTKDIMQELNMKKGVQFVEVIESVDGKIVVDPGSAKKINWEKIQKGLITAGRVLQFILTVL